MLKSEKEKHQDIDFDGMVQQVTYNGNASTAVSFVVPAEAVEWIGEKRADFSKYIVELTKGQTVV